MKRLFMMGVLALASGCIGGGGSSGGGDGLPWVSCSEVEGEAPCCPQIDVEALCEPDDTFEPVEAENPDFASSACRRSDGLTSASAGALRSDGFVSVVAYFPTGTPQLPWVGTMFCGADGRVIRFEALDGSPTGCTAACFAETEAECSPDEPVCPEMNPFPLEQALHAEEAPDGGT